MLLIPIACEYVPDHSHSARTARGRNCFRTWWNGEWDTQGPAHRRLPPPELPAARSRTTAPLRKALLHISVQVLTPPSLRADFAPHRSVQVLQGGSRGRPAPHAAGTAPSAPHPPSARTRGSRPASPPCALLGGSAQPGTAPGRPHNAEGLPAPPLLRPAAQCGASARSSAPRLLRPAAAPQRPRTSRAPCGLPRAPGAARSRAGGTRSGRKGCAEVAAEVAPLPPRCLTRAPEEGAQPNNSAVPQPLITCGSCVRSLAWILPKHLLPGSAKAAPQFILTSRVLSFPLWLPQCCSAVPACAAPCRASLSCPDTCDSRVTAGLLPRHTAFQ